MNVIVCLDDDLGMMFNKRRQSRDEKIVEDILRFANELWIDEFSEKLLSGTELKLKVSEDFLSKAGNGEYCFVEDKIILPYVDRVERIIVYKWNRKYPSDVKFDVPLNEWGMEEQTDFVGKSHEKITREIYVRRKGI